jgi:hypothetical protein
MCNQRERLIGYVYDESDAGERAAVQQHLESCAECRTEVAALRSVRTDLQTWEVPDHASVWQPFAPKAAPAWWSQVPRWAMAAAAGVVLMAGAGGGAVSYALLRAEPATASNAQQTTDVVTRAALDDFERRLDTRIKAEVAQLNARVQLVSSRGTSPASMTADLSASLHESFGRQIAELRAGNDKQVEAINAIYNNLGQLKKGFDLRHDALKITVSNLTALVDQGQGR